MRTRRPATLAAILVFAALPLLASAALAAPGNARAGAALARHEAVVAHWTAERMRAAVPRDFTWDPVRGFQPAAKPPGPPGGGGGGGDPTNTAGSSWPNGKGEIYEGVGKVYFEMGGSGWICSGSVATDSRTGESIVLTAGHCAYDETADGNVSGFAENWLFIPEYDADPTLTCANTLHGCWTAEKLFVHRGFATAGAFNTQATLHDWAFAVVGPGGHSGTASLESIARFPIDADQSYAETTQMYAFGYPAAQRYKGYDLTYCAGPVFFDPYNNDLTYGLTCNMTGGSSGGPWLSNFDVDTGDSGTLSSVNSYGYSGVKAMHGPKFGSLTADTWDAANTSSLGGSGRGVIVGP